MNFDRNKTLFLIDGSSFLYRAYYGLRPLHTSSGEAVQAVFSFCRMIKKIVTTFDPAYLVLVWDSKGKTVRHEIYDEYKATRDAPPTDLFSQKDRIVAFADLIGLAQISKNGVEADDLMFSLARDWTEKGGTAVLVTTDKDMGQALTMPCTYLYDAFKETMYDAAAFEKKMELPPSKLPFYFALLGDSSDNIPGVKGIGKKGALELVHQFESLKELYENIDRVAKERTKNALIEHKQDAFLSEKLFLLHYYPLNRDAVSLAFDKANWKQATPLFQELNFKSFLEEKTISTDGLLEKITFFKERYRFECITTPEQLARVVQEIAAAGVFALDTETDGVDEHSAQLVGLSVCMQEGVAYYIPCAHQTEEVQLSLDQIKQSLKPVFENDQCKKYLHNSKFDQLVLSTNGIELAGVVFDTMIAASLLLKDWQKKGLKDLSESLLDESMISYQEVVKDQKLKNFSFVPLEHATYYAACDAHQTWRLAQIFMPQLKQEKLDTLFYTVEMPTMHVLYGMEKKGIYLDTAFLKMVNEKITAEISDIERQMRALVDDDGTINFNSPAQMQTLLFEKLQLPPQKKSGKKTGYSTDREVLETLSPLHPIAGFILKYRELYKLKSTYIQALPDYVNARTGRIHTSYNQISVATGRLASSEPNLQNIPTALGYGMAIREAFKADPGYLFISADYSQIELRVLAHLSGDQTLCAAFIEGHDVHQETAALIFDVPLPEVTDQQRQVGKRINFSILYGLTPFGLSQDLSIPLADAKRYIEKYLAQYPAVSSWMAQVIAFAAEHGYVSTLGGRRRYVPGMYEKNKALYEEAKRVAVNTVAQGTAAEVMKMGMIACDQALKKEGIDGQILLQIHDELLVSVRADQQKIADQIIKKSLESVVSWRVPLRVNTQAGADWKAVS